MRGIVQWKHSLKMYLLRKTKVLVVIVSILLLTARAKAATLILIENKNCQRCIAWEKQVGNIYSKTETGKLAPLRRININEAWPKELMFIKKAVYTPTFILLDKKKEIGRIFGFTSDYQFWGQLEKLISQISD